MEAPAPAAGIRRSVLRVRRERAVFGSKVPSREGVRSPIFRKDAVARAGAGAAAGVGALGGLGVEHIVGLLLLEVMVANQGDHLLLPD